MREHAKAGEKTFKGIPVSAGISRGKILVVRKAEVSIPRHEVSEDEIPAHIARFEKALLDTRRQLLEVQRRVNEGVGAEHASIFDAHLLVLEDPILIEEVTRAIEKKKLNAEWAFHEFAQK